jgi:glycosyltransferase involved in cell wall biosynthesis
MSSKVIVHISADFPDSMAPAKTSSVASLIKATEGYRHIVYSLNRVSLVSGIVAVDFGPDRKAIAYGAPPKGLFLATYLDRVADWILKDIESRDIPVDALHLHKFSAEGLVGQKIAQSLKRPFIVNLWGDTDLKVVKYRPDLKATWKSILDQAALIIPHTPWVEERFDELFGLDHSKSMILPAITQHEHFTPSPIISEPRFVTLFNLDVHRRKNLAALVTVMDRMSQRIPGISLDVYGKGSPKTMFEVSQIVEKSKARNVTLKGPLPGDGFTTILGDNVAFLMPTRRETFGMVFIEALFSGLPLLHTKGWGIDGFFAEDEVGYACDPSNHDDIESGVSRLLTEQERFKRSIAALHERGGLDRFKRKAIAETYRAGLERVLGRTEQRERVLSEAAAVP